MDLGIKNKVALVTASSKGLGKAVAFRLVMEGAKVMICSRNEENVIHAQDEIASQTGGIVNSFICDVTREENVHKMIEQIIEEFKTIDILVCNAGGPPAGMATDFSLKDYHFPLQRNLLFLLLILLWVLNK